METSEWRECWRHVSGRIGTDVETCEWRAVLVVRLLICERKQTETVFPSGTTGSRLMM